MEEELQKQMSITGQMYNQGYNEAIRRVSEWINEREPRMLDILRTTNNEKTEYGKGYKLGVETAMSIVKMKLNPIR